MSVTGCLADVFMGMFWFWSAVTDEEGDGIRVVLGDC